MTYTPDEIEAMQAEATPGPWHVQKCHEAGIAQGWFVSAGGFCRADMTGPDAAQGPNARLIAAAPTVFGQAVRALRQVEALERRNERLRAENDRMRYIIASSNLPCLYCGLPGADMAKCPDGFPGCGRADDLMHDGSEATSDE